MELLQLYSDRSSLSFNLNYSCINKLSPLLHSVFQRSLHQCHFKTPMPGSNSSVWTLDININAHISLACALPPSPPSSGRFGANRDLQQNDPSTLFLSCFPELILSLEFFSVLLSVCTASNLGKIIKILLWFFPQVIHEMEEGQHDSVLCYVLGWWPRELSWSTIATPGCLEIFLPVFYWG